MRPFKFIFSVLFILSVVAWRAPVATFWWASPTGSGTSCGTASLSPSGTPCLLQAAYNQAAPGDTVILRGGTYTGKFGFSTDTTAGNETTIRSYCAYLVGGCPANPSEWAKIDGYVHTTLNGEIDSSTTTLTLTDGSQFSQNDVVWIGDDGSAPAESLLLWTKSGNQFGPGNIRGYNGTTPTSHGNGAVVRNDSPVVTIDGNYTILRDVEVFSSLPIRSWNFTQSDPSLYASQGVRIFADHVSLINVIIHDTRDAIFSN